MGRQARAAELRCEEARAEADALRRSLAAAAAAADEDGGGGGGAVWEARLAALEAALGSARQQARGRDHGGRGERCGDRAARAGGAVA
jgi:hypothetical protein